MELVIGLLVVAVLVAAAIWLARRRGSSPDSSGASSTQVYADAMDQLQNGGFKLLQRGGNLPGIVLVSSYGPDNPYVAVHFVILKLGDDDQVRLEARSDKIMAEVRRIMRPQTLSRIQTSIVP